MTDAEILGNSKFKEVSAIVGTYLTKNGEERNVYKKLGRVVSTKHGLMLCLESIPFGMTPAKDGSVWAYINEPFDKEPTNTQNKETNEIKDDDVPF